MPGAVSGAKPAGRAVIRDDITRVQFDVGGKVTWFSFQGKELGVGKNFDIGRPTGLDQFWRQDSERAVVGREGLVQLGHDPADGG
jgi:hypothetical protein